MCFSQNFLSWVDSSRYCHVMFSPTISVLGEAAKTIWHWVNMAIVKLMLCFTTVVHGSFMFCFKKALSPWNFKCRGDKSLATCWRPVIKFWSPTLHFWSHWWLVSRNVWHRSWAIVIFFGVWHKMQWVAIIATVKKQPLANLMVISEECSCLSLETTFAL